MSSSCLGRRVDLETERVLEDERMDYAIVCIPVIDPEGGSIFSCAASAETMSLTAVSAIYRAPVRSVHATPSGSVSRWAPFTRSMYSIATTVIACGRLTSAVSPVLYVSVCKERQQACSILPREFLRWVTALACVGCQYLLHPSVGPR